MLTSWVMAPRASFSFVALALVLAAVASGCGPSLRRVHQGNVYFERCYAADLDALVPPTERRTCWQAWHAHYQTGASPERIDYVTERLAMLDPAQAEAIALATGTDPTEVGARTDDTALARMVAPEAPPPAREPEAIEPTLTTTDGSEPVASLEDAPHARLVEDTATHIQIVDQEERERAEERRSHRTIVIPRSTTPHCARSCRPVWERCAATCSAHERGCIAACRQELVVCSHGCY